MDAWKRDNTNDNYNSLNTFVLGTEFIVDIVIICICINLNVSSS